MKITPAILQRIRLTAFILTIAAAAAIPLATVLKYEFPKVPPRRYLVEVGGYDPIDLFRGHYLALEPQDMVVLEDVTTDEVEVYASRLPNYRWAVVTTDENTGLARFRPVVERPDSGDYISIEGVWPDWSQNREKTEEKKNDPAQKDLPPGKVLPYHPRVRISFKETLRKFYINEKLEPKAEEAIAKLRNTPGKVCLVMNLYNDGHYTVTDLLLEGLPVREYLKQQQ